MAKNKPHAKRGDYALTGKLICAECGAAMTGTSGTGKSGETFYYYKCPGRDRRPIPQDRIEHAVAECVRGGLSEPERLEALVDKLLAYQREEMAADARFCALEKNLKETERRIERAVDEIVDHGGTPALRERLEQLEADRAIMRADLEKLQRGPVLSRDVIREGLQLALITDQVSDAAVIRIFVHQVLLHEDGRFIVEYNFKGAGDALEKSDLLVFDQSAEWWSIGETGRTLTVWRGRVLALSRI